MTSEHEAPPGDEAPVTVLLVDDVPEVRVLVRTALRVRGGFRVIGEASEGNEAVELAAALRPDVVVLDIGLPDLGGQEVLTRIRTRSALSKVVVFTGTPSQAVGAEKRADGFVLKGADTAYLVELLETLGRRRQHAALYLHADEGAAEARRFARGVVAGWEIGELLDDVLLVVSELVTNAFTHAGPTCRLQLSRTPSGIRVEVFDDGRGTPDPQVVDPLSEHGRGLYLVGALASAWGTGTTDEHGGKVVWAELPRLAAQRGGPSHVAQGTPDYRFSFTPLSLL